MRNRNNKTSLAQINITNLVDIALTLVIILLMIAPMIEHGIEVQLPKSSPYEMKIEKSIIITVAPENQYFIAGKKMSLEEIYNFLKEKSHEKDISVIVKGDEKVFYEDIVRILDIVKKCKIDLIGLATQVE
ncbi:MAG: biopolymer transporter ExbD [bacterium]|nr:biopolymer transporter ExbD [bacterium]MCX7916514.1 biopolymer transporter ExbD [bacterium]MDW8164399.1 biopolymer transporter ExbD [Candidatus Omnitrophota bacterium]